MLKRLVFTDRAAGGCCASRLLVLLFLGSEAFWRSGKEVKRVRCGSGEAGSWVGEPGGVKRSADKFMCGGCELAEAGARGTSWQAREERGRRGGAAGAGATGKRGGGGGGGGIKGSRRAGGRSRKHQAER